MPAYSEKIGIYTPATFVCSRVCVYLDAGKCVYIKI